MISRKIIIVLFTFVWLSVVSAHYVFPSIEGTPPWDVVRRTDNHYSRAPVMDVHEPNFRCYNGAGGSAPNTYTIAAGGQLTFNADDNMYHIGVLNIYMARAPGRVIDFNGDGNVWFKVHEITAYPDPNGVNYPDYPVTTMNKVTFTIPKNLPSGEYLVRIEQIGLHDASGGAQFYIACAQVRVTGGGNGTPGPLVSIPGVYTGNEPGIRFNPYWPVPTSYVQPGPAVWSG